MLCISSLLRCVSFLFVFHIIYSSNFLTFIIWKVEPRSIKFLSSQLSFTQRPKLHSNRDQGFTQTFTPTSTNFHSNKASPTEAKAKLHWDNKAALIQRPKLLKQTKKLHSNRDQKHHSETIAFLEQRQTQNIFTPS